jgi:dienelactone hydrolase
MIRSGLRARGRGKEGVTAGDGCGPVAGACRSRRWRSTTARIAGLAVALAVSAGASAPAAAEEPRLPLLEPGRHAVGWKAFIRSDFARPYPDAFVKPGKGARPILFAVWYPAVNRGGSQERAARLAQGDYLRLEEISPLHAKFLQRLQAVSRQVIAEEVVEPSERWLLDADPEPLRRHLQRETLATRGAPAAPGTYPLLIYHPGLSGYYADSSPLLEHLASHGYIVVASAFQPAAPESLRIDADLDRSRSDIEFILAEMRNDQQVDFDRIGLLGHSFGAIAALATSMRNSLIGAVASLDSTLDHEPIRNLPFEGPWALFLDPELLQVPALIFARKEGVRFELVKSFTSAERLLVELPGVDHNTFIWHGPSGASLRADPAAARRVEAYRTVILFTQQFFDAHLKQNDRAIAFLATQTEEGQGFRFERLPGKPPPSATELGAGLLARGEGPGLTWLEAQIKKDALPYSLIKDVVLALREREQPALAKLVAEMSVIIYGDNFLAFEELGDLQARDRQWERARDSYREALQKLRPARIRPPEMKTTLRTRLTSKVDRCKRLITEAAQAGAPPQP